MQLDEKKEKTQCKYKNCQTPHYSLFSQKSGHYLDSLAATIDTTLEEEELIADQLKEWLFGASALQAVVRRREALQLAKDEAQDALTAAFEQKEKVMQGIGKYLCVRSNI